MKTIQIRVKPNAHASYLEPAGDGTFIARVAAAPVDGKANAELVRLVAEYFGVRRSQISIRSGAGGRTKIVRIDDQ